LLAASESKAEDEEAPGVDLRTGESHVTNERTLAREWVEIREESGEGRVVLRPSTHPLPPARGRRRLDLRTEGKAVPKAPGPTDQLQASGAGEWSLEGNTLHLTAPGWSGDYLILEVTEDVLVLQRK
jgi:hypothetical protein